MSNTKQLDGNAKRIMILAVIPSSETRQALRSVFRSSNWRIVFTESVAETIRFLERDPTPVVLCEQKLADGTWRDLLDALAAVDSPPSVVLTSRLADAVLWAEALNRGCYDILAQPFDAAELFRVLTLAWHRSNDCPTRPRGYSAHQAFENRPRGCLHSG
jgi:DNA-binding NtrC family response regulator